MATSRAIASGFPCVIRPVVRPEGEQCADGAGEGQGGRGGAGAGGWGAVCAGPAGRDDGEAGRGHGAAKGACPASLQEQRHTLQTHPTGPPSHLPLATIPLSCGTPDLKNFVVKCKRENALSTLCIAMHPSVYTTKVCV